MLRNSALHFCSALGIAVVPGNLFLKPLDSYSEAVGFLGFCSDAMSHHLDFQISHSNGAKLPCWHIRLDDRDRRFASMSKPLSTMSGF